MRNYFEEDYLSNDLPDLSEETMKKGNLPPFLTNEQIEYRDRVEEVVTGLRINKDNGLVLNPNIFPVKLLIMPFGAIPEPKLEEDVKVVESKTSKIDSALAT